MRQFLSIRYKFLLVTTFLLVFCVGVYLFMASRIFKQDKTELVFDYNRSLVSNIASDLESVLKSASDKMELVAYFYRESDSKNLKVLQEMLQSDSQLVFVSGSNTFEKIDKIFFEDELTLKTYGLEKSFYTEDMPKTKPIPFRQIQTEGEVIWNASIEGGPPLIGLGRNIVEENKNGQVIKQYAIIGFIKADKILSSLKQVNLNEVFVSNDKGEILIHKDPQKMIKSDKSLADKFFSNAKVQNHGTQVLSFNTKKGKVLGAVSHSFNNQVSVVSQVSAKKAFAVVNQLIFRSITFAAMVFTLAFIAAILFSRSLTRPIETLVQGMKKVSDGNLETQIFVKSRDEISVLANSFNSMIYDLKESREELEEINKNLEIKVKERTLELERQNQAVKNAQEALLKTTRLASIGEIAGRAAHEVLNPLTSIISRIQKVQDRVQRDKKNEIQLLIDIRKSWQQDFDKGGFEKLVQIWQKPSDIKNGQSLWQEDMGNIDQLSTNLSKEMDDLTFDTKFLMRESQRINRIVQSMRSLSVVKSAAEAMDVEKIIGDSIDIMADLASQKNIRILFEKKNLKLHVLVDEDEFIQSLTNLLRNAIQAVESRQIVNGEVRLFVKETDQKINILIEDNGVGIPEKVKERLFDSQITTKPKEEGTGLGLNISRRFIRAFGGDIFLQRSEENQGTCFVLELPRHEPIDERKSA